jgi:hypothetical protein
MNAKLTYKAGIGDVVTVDPAAFLIEARKYFDLSTMTEKWKAVTYLGWPGAILPPNTWDTVAKLSDLFKFVCASVEVAKQKVLDEFDPDRSKGTKFDKDVALGTAVGMVATLVKFKNPGWWPFFGTMMNKIWPVMITLLIQFYFTGQAINWAAVAMQILAL